MLDVNQYQYIENIKKRLSEEGFCYLTVKIIPRSAKNEIVELMENQTIKIRIAAPAEKNKANNELLYFLKKIFALPKSQITILNGKNDRTKLLKISASQKTSRPKLFDR